MPRKIAPVVVPQDRRNSSAPIPIVRFDLNSPPLSPEALSEQSKNFHNLCAGFKKASELSKNHQGVTIVDLTKNE